MLFYGVLFAAVFFAFYPSGKAHDKNWVQQWPSEVYKTPGENLTMHCQTHGGLRKAMCLVQWFIKNSNGNFDSIDQFIQFRERYSQHKNTTHFRQSFTLLSLKLNDTGSFHCNYLCKSNSTYEQYYGNGTQLFVHFRTENVTLSTAIFNSNITDGLDGESRVSVFFQFPVIIVLLSKLVVFMFMTFAALFSPH